MSVHLTPTELAEELHMKRRDVLSKCIEMNVPVLKGRIDKTLFVSFAPGVPGAGQTGHSLSLTWLGSQA